MNAPANIPNRRDAYAPIVQQALPGCAGEELAIRCGMMLIRDEAVTLARNPLLQEDAARWVKEIADLASHAATACMSLQALRHVRIALVQLRVATNNLQLAIGPREGDDARG